VAHQTYRVCGDGSHNRRHRRRPAGRLFPDRHHAAGDDRKHKAPRLAEAAVALFAVSAALFLYALQFTGLALGYRASPGERQAYYPETKTDEKALDKVRKQQWQETKLWLTFSAQAGTCYNLGLLCFLLGLGAVIVPRDTWSPGRVVALSIVILAIAFEATWVLSNASRPTWLLPTRRSPKVAYTRVPDIPDDVRDVLMERRTMPELRELTTELERLRSVLEGTVHVHGDHSTAGRDGDASEGESTEVGRQGGEWVEARQEEAEPGGTDRARQDKADGAVRGETPGKFVIRKGSTGKFRFNLVSTNGQILATSEAYNTRAAAKKGIKSVQKLAGEATVEDQTTKEWAAGEGTRNAAAATKKAKRAAAIKVSSSGS
jgi:uncharacterized protein YegP (UPF0339 family)